MVVGNWDVFFKACFVELLKYVGGTWWVDFEMLCKQWIGLITYIPKAIFALFPPNSYELKSSDRQPSHFLDVWLIML